MMESAPSYEALVSFCQLLAIRVTLRHAALVATNVRHSLAVLACEMFHTVHAASIFPTVHR
jgi:hypothetical protein